MGSFASPTPLLKKVIASIKIQIRDSIFWNTDIPMCHKNKNIDLIDMNNGRSCIKSVASTVAFLAIY